MPKDKTHKGLAKRIKVTGTGKLLRRKTGRRHLLSTKTAKRRRRLRREEEMTGKKAGMIRRAIT